MNDLELDYIDQLVEHGYAVCPMCGGEMNEWEAFLTYGETCTECGWTSFGVDDENY